MRLAIFHFFDICEGYVWMSLHFFFSGFLSILGQTPLKVVHNRRHLDLDKWSEGKCQGGNERCGREVVKYGQC